MHPLNETRDLIARLATAIQERPATSISLEAEEKQAQRDLKAEYLPIQSHYEACDRRSGRSSMKALATPLLSAGIAFGLKEQSTTAPL